MADELEFFGFSYIFFFFFWPGVFSNLLPVFNWIAHLSLFSGAVVEVLYVSWVQVLGQVHV